MNYGQQIGDVAQGEAGYWRAVAEKEAHGLSNARAQADRPAMTAGQITSATHMDQLIMRLQVLLEMSYRSRARVGAAVDRLIGLPPPSSPAPGNQTSAVQESSIARIASLVQEIEAALAGTHGWLDQLEQIV